MQAAIGRANCRANVVIDLDLRRASAAELATRAKAGSDAAFQELARRMDPALRAMARNYWARGLTCDDLHQEALVGLSEAVRDYRPDRGASFETFAKLCVNRELMTAVKTALRGEGDAWDFHSYLASVIAAGVRELAENIHGCPGPLVDISGGDIDEGCRRWRAILEEIVAGFEAEVQADRDFEPRPPEFERSLELLGIWWRDLWD